MELVLVVGAVVILLMSGPRKARIERYRGPAEGSMDEVQEEHLWLFRAPRGPREE